MREKPWTDVEIAPDVEAISKMLSPEETRYLIWATERCYEGWGAVVDLGPWLGGSSAALAEGLKRHGSAAKVRSFDLFEWRPFYMEASSPRGLAAGQDFMPIFLEETRKYRPWIEAQRMDLLNGTWDGGPIEILFVDAAKSWLLLAAILRVFGPFLEAGRSRVIHQDFRHPWCHWLPLTCDDRPDVWREVDATDHGDTVTFQPLVDLVDAGVTTATYEEQSFDLERAKEIFDRRIENATLVRHQQQYRLALMRKAILAGGHGLAQQLKEELLAKNEDVKPSWLQARYAKEIERILGSRTK